jgi:hypothetical protein
MTESVTESAATTDVFAEIAVAARALGQPGQPHAFFAALDRALGRAIGHKLFTILLLRPDTNESERLYTNMPAAYPLAGRKPRRDTAWTQRVFDRGEVYIGRNGADIRANFPDHDLILSLGCAAVMNLPVRYDGETLGTVNLLDRAGRYDDAKARLGRPFAQLAVPAFLALRRQIRGA